MEGWSINKMVNEFQFQNLQISKLTIIVESMIDVIYYLLLVVSVCFQLIDNDAKRLFW